MNNFKIKKIKRSSEKIYNLESKHKEVVSSFENNNNVNIPNKLNEIKLLQNDIDIISNKLNKTSDDIKSIFNKKTQIKKITEEIKTLKEKQKNYFNNVSIILHDHLDDNSENEIKINKYVKKIEVNNKAKLFDKYMSVTSNNYTLTDVLNDDDDNYCTKCQCEKTLIQSKGIIVCQNCGQVEKYIIDSDKPSYKEPPPEINYFAYKRINHFRECLSQFQAKESTNIPSEIYKEIMIEVKKDRKDIKKVTKQYVRKLLKKLGHNKYYEHIPHIINKLNGKPAPVLPKHIEEKLNSMFIQIQEPYAEFCPDNRSNFLNYSYVLYKFFELLELDEYLEHFSLLKSKEKLYNHDCIWRKFCKKLKWEFIPSL